eukprot:5416226-Prymnesium_polylepis.1
MYQPATETELAMNELGPGPSMRLAVTAGSSAAQHGGEPSTLRLEEETGKGVASVSSSRALESCRHQRRVRATRHRERVSPSCASALRFTFTEAVFTEDDQHCPPKSGDPPDSLWPPGAPA